MTIDRILSIIAIIASFIAVPASGYLSYRYAIKGEKRKEFNAIADNLRKRFREQLRFIEQGFYPADGTLEVKDFEIEMLIDVSPSMKKRDIQAVWKDYLSALKSAGDFNEYGEFKVHDLGPVSHAIKALMPHIERR